MSLILHLITIVASTGGERTSAGPIDRPPNVVLIMSDDQGFGDAGFHGNPMIHTPALDRLSREGAEMTRFYVSPVCAPTRASLLTGRYNYRTGVVDTYQGRAMMDPAEVTLAEHLSAAGYRCGIFGKWHLGDNAPMRAQDQGFHEVLTHRGGGIGQPSDPPGGSSYFDPILAHNGVLRRYRGYCSDIFTDAAISFVEANRDAPFFAYVAFNAPHVPLEVPKADLERVLTRDLGRVELPGLAAADPAARAREREAIARVYAMVENIDKNVQRLLATLEALGLSGNTLVIFLTDNGPQQPRFNAGLRGLKGSVFEGGVRVPFLARLPGRIPPGLKNATASAHIDVVPTVLEACGVSSEPSQPKIDGRSVWPVLTGAVEKLDDRPFFVQWHRGDVPELGRACAVITDRWKAVQPNGVGEGPFPGNARWQLFDLVSDPGEQRDVAHEHPERVSSMRRLYDAWFLDVSTTRGFDPPRIQVGTGRENPVVLTRQDWRARPGDPSPTPCGVWEIEMSEGIYDVDVDVVAPQKPARVLLSIGPFSQTVPLAAGQSRVSFNRVRLPAGAARLEARLETDGNASSPVGALYVELTRLSNP